ncbi:MAG: nicotinate-nicotinamide nucleotide adenylyltransferase [Pseudomonadota bacterium]
MARRKWIGAFGGSFDPPHLGHLLAAVYALKVFELDEVWFVPAYQHAFGKKLSPFSKRLRMCRELIKGLGLKLKISTIEREIRSDGKMLRTLLALRKRHRHSRFSLVIGSDILRQKRRWYRFSEIEKRFGILVVPRGSAPAGNIAIPDVSSTEVRRRLRRRKPLDNLLTPAVAALWKRLT